MLRSTPRLKSMANMCKAAAKQTVSFSTTSPKVETTHTASSPKMASFAMVFPSKKEDESGLSSYYNNKTTIIQEARVFNESPISPRKCRALLTRIVYLLYVGETFGTQEATTLFFGTTKLFQHRDVRSVLRSQCISCLFIIITECPPAGGLSRNQGARDDGGGRYYGYQQHNEGYATQLRGHLPPECNSCPLQNH